MNFLKNTIQLAAANSYSMTLTSTPIRNREELKTFQSFLEVNNLPFSDLKLDGNFFTLFYDGAGNIIGSGGLEIYGDVALIRSIAVVQSDRGKSLGRRIVDEVIQQAKERKIKSVLLLTETAHGFFLKKGFVDISREEVPAAVKDSSEFSFVCPASAKCMMYTLE